MPSFNCSDADLRIIRQITTRSRNLLANMGVDRSSLDIQMDLVATNANGNPLRLADLLAADNTNLLHDVCGIAKHLDRNTGKLADGFRPRHSARS